MDDTPEDQARAEQPAPEPSQADRVMAHIDAALAPALNNARELGPVNHSTLAHALQSIRQALAHLVYGVPEPSEHDGESLDMLGEQRKAQREANTEAAPPEEPAPVAEDLPPPEQQPFAQAQAEPFS